MNKSSKKINISIYYLALIIGAILMNFIITRHGDFAGELIGSFQSLDKLNNINEREMFIYVLFKRLKQIMIFFLMYRLLSETVTLILIPSYASFIAGSTISLFCYYYGLTGILYSIIIFIPIVFPYGFLYYRYWLNCLKDKKYSHNRKEFSLFLFVFLIIVGVLIEMCVNRCLGVLIYFNK